MNLAAASGEDLATTSDIVTDALTAFGLTAQDSGHFADILAAASSNANTNVAMMGETFKYCAPIAGALGFSAEDTAEAIGLMANAGIKSTQAGTALRTIMNNLISLEEAKSYLRVDTEDEDAMIAILLSSAGKLCADVARLTDEQWAAVNNDNEDATLGPTRETMRVAILYALGYLFEHREEADHHSLTLTLRSLLFGLREGVV